MEEISLHILDVAENALGAGARRIGIRLEIDEKNDRLRLELTDDGRGMTPEVLRQAADPFFTTRTTRRIGLGLPLLKQAAEQSGGSFSLESSPGRGTAVKAEFGLSHWDRPPLGDMASTLLTLIVGRPEVDFVYRQVTGAGEFELDSGEIKQVLEGVSLSDPEVVLFLEKNVREATAGLAGV
ncbi:MAG: ATP-binding protein [Pseudomonadota bacterium]